MTIARATRILLASAASLIVVWAFFDVGRRAVARWKLQHDRPITLTMLHWGDPDEVGIVQKLVARFEQDNPRIRINRINVPSGDFRAKLTTMRAAGDPPDRFDLPADLFPELATLRRRSQGRTARFIRVVAASVALTVVSSTAT